MYSWRTNTCPTHGERLVPADGCPLIGEVIDRYKLVDFIGEGAVGCVCKATHVSIPKTYAIKILFRDLANDGVFIERFKREARAAGALDHPNIVSVHDFVTMPDGLAFIVMELIEGKTLAEVIEQQRPIAPERAARITKQIASGLGEAHRAGFIHRDIKPANIIITGTGKSEVAKILDFGMVAGLDSDMGHRLTTVGRLVGTPLYMAPEMVDRNKVGLTADLYSLGVVLFEMLTGEPPFKGAHPSAVIVQHMTEPVPPVGLHEGLEHAVAWLLQKEPARRPQSASELIRMLDQLSLNQRPQFSPGDTSPDSDKAKLAITPVDHDFSDDATALTTRSHVPRSDGFEVTEPHLLLSSVDEAGTVLRDERERMIVEPIKTGGDAPHVVVVSELNTQVDYAPRSNVDPALLVFDDSSPPKPIAVRSLRSKEAATTPAPDVSPSETDDLAKAAARTPTPTRSPRVEPTVISAPLLDAHTEISLPPDSAAAATLPISGDVPDSTRSTGDTVPPPSPEPPPPIEIRYAETLPPASVYVRTPVEHQAAWPALLALGGIVFFLTVLVLVLWGSCVS
jgi:serine/threonine protein kinase